MDLMCHISPSSLCNQQLQRVLEFYSSLHQFCWTAGYIVVKPVTALLPHHLIANSGPFHLKKVSVFLSFAVITAFGRPFLFEHTVPQAYVELKNVPHKVLDLYTNCPYTCNVLCPKGVLNP